MKLSALRLTALVILVVSRFAGAQSATSFGMIGITRGQTLRLTLTSSVQTTATGGSSEFEPCTATLGFQDADGNPVGPSQTVTLSDPFQGMPLNASVSLDGDTIIPFRLFVFNARAEILPTVTFPAPPPGIPPTPCGIATAEVVDNLTGIATVAVPGQVSFPIYPGTSHNRIPYGIMALVGSANVVAGLQTMRLNWVAYPGGGYCSPLDYGFLVNTSPPAPISHFELGPAGLSVPPGYATFDDLQFYALGPALEWFPLTDVEEGFNNCVFSLEVYNNLTGRTETYLPERACNSSDTFGCISFVPQPGP